MDRTSACPDGRGAANLVAASRMRLRHRIEPTLSKLRWPPHGVFALHRPISNTGGARVDSGLCGDAVSCVELVAAVAEKRLSKVATRSANARTSCRRADSAPGYMYVS